MDKITYLAELAEGLARWVPERERQDILRWYAEYFEEAGQDREAEVMAELGDPWALSCRLAVEGGYVTREQALSWRPGKTWPKVLTGVAVGLSVFALVSGIGLFAMNAVRFGNGFARNTAVVIDEGSEAVPFGEALEGVTIVDSANFASVEEYMALIDGESVVPFGSIDADISLGSIQVVAGDDYTLSIWRSETLLGYEPVLETRDGVLRLRDGGLSEQVRVNSWEDLKNLFGVGRGSVEVIVTVPEGAELDKVSAKTRLGDVMLWGVSAEAVTAETGVGDVKCFEVRNAGVLDLTTGVGDVYLALDEVRSGLDIALESGTGNVEADLGCPAGDCHYELESGLGIVTVDGGRMGSKAVHKGNLPYRLRAESGTGSVSVRFN